MAKLISIAVFASNKGYCEFNYDTIKRVGVKFTQVRGVSDLKGKGYDAYVIHHSAPLDFLKDIKDNQGLLNHYINGTEINNTGASIERNDRGGF